MGSDHILDGSCVDHLSLEVDLLNLVVDVPPFCPQIPSVLKHSTSSSIYRLIIVSRIMTLILSYSILFKVIVSYHTIICDFFHKDITWAGRAIIVLVRLGQEVID